MSKYFGTDGFRGEANINLNSLHAYKIGRYLGYRSHELSAPERPRIVIGKDTRHSGDMFEMALAAGICSTGCDVDLLGVITTPGVAYTTRSNDYAFGIMISASHNPYYDNGIKVLNAQGEKLEECVIDDIETYIDASIEDVPEAKRDEIGRVFDAANLCEKYIDHLVSTVSVRFDGLQVALDCANGSASSIAPRVFEKLGAQVAVISNQPDGLNINVDCGSTHIGALCDFVSKGSYIAGFAYDGDADRCLASDEQGVAVDGDQIMYLCARFMKEQGNLPTNTLVTTIMSNFGLYKALDAAGISYEKTAVGDKYVYENMAANNHAIGGEQSGHIIFKEFATTGDGILTSLMVMQTLVKTQKALSVGVADMVVYPQVLKNVRVVSKQDTLDDADVKMAIQTGSDTLADDGRVLVRQSGTEPVIRVMAEAGSHELCEQVVDEIISVIASKGYLCK